MPTSGADWPMQYETVKSQRTRATSTDFHRLPQTSTDFHSSNSAAFNKVSTENLKCPKCPKCPSAQVPGSWTCCPSWKRKNPCLARSQPEAKRQNSKLKKKMPKETPKESEKRQTMPKDAYSRSSYKGWNLQGWPRDAVSASLDYIPWKLVQSARTRRPRWEMRWWWAASPATCNSWNSWNSWKIDFSCSRDLTGIWQGSEGIWRDLKGSEGYGFVHLMVTGLSL